MFEGVANKFKFMPAAPAEEKKPAHKTRVRSAAEPIVTGIFAYGAIILALIYTFSASYLFYSGFEVEHAGSWVYVVGGFAVAMADAAFLTIVIRNLSRGKRGAALVSGLLWFVVMGAAMVAEAGLFAAVIDHKDDPAAAQEAKYKPARDKVDRLQRELKAIEKRGEPGRPEDISADLEAYLAQAAVNSNGDELRSSVRQVINWPDGCSKGGYFVRMYCPTALAKTAKAADAKRLVELRGGTNPDGTHKAGLVEAAEGELEALGPEPRASVPLFRLMAEAMGSSEAFWTLTMIFVLAGAVHMILTFGVWVANEALLEDPEAKAARLAAIAAMKAEEAASISRAEHEAALEKLSDDLAAELEALRITHEAEKAKAIEDARAEVEAELLALRAEREREAAERPNAPQKPETRAVDDESEPARPNFEKGLPPERMADPTPPPAEPATLPADPTPPEPIKMEADHDPDPIRGDDDARDAGAGEPGGPGEPSDGDNRAGPDGRPDGDESAGDPDDAEQPDPAAGGTSGDQDHAGDDGVTLGDGDLSDVDPLGDPGDHNRNDDPDPVTNPPPAEPAAPASGPDAALEDEIPAPAIDLSKMKAAPIDEPIDELVLR